MTDNLLLESFALFTWTASLKATLLVLLILVVRKGFAGLLTPSGNYLLWGSVILCLVLPIGYEIRLPEFPLHSVLTSPPAESLPPPLQPLTATSPGLAVENPVAQPTGPVTLADISANAVPSAIGNTGPAEAVTPAGIRLESLLAPAWFSIALVFFALVLRRHLTYRRIIRQAAPADGDICREVDRCAERLGVSRRPDVRVTPAVSTPCIVGCLRPVLLLPPGLGAVLNSTQQRHVFLHELMHVKRHDHAANWLATVLNCLHWFNPVLWLAFRIMRQDREQACDAAVLAVIGKASGTAYARTLLAMAGHLVDRAAPAPAIGMLDGRGKLHARIHQILSPTGVTSFRGLCSGLCLAILTGLAFAQPAVREPALAQDADVAKTAVTRAAAPDAQAIINDTAIDESPIDPDALLMESPATLFRPAPVAALRPDTLPDPVPEMDFPGFGAPAESAITNPTEHPPLPLRAASPRNVIQPVDADFMFAELVAVLDAEIERVQAENLAQARQWNESAMACELNSGALFRQSNGACRETRLIADTLPAYIAACLLTSGAHTSTVDFGYPATLVKRHLERLNEIIAAHKRRLASACGMTVFGEQFPVFDQLVTRVTGDPENKSAINALYLEFKERYQVEILHAANQDFTTAQATDLILASREISQNKPRHVFYGDRTVNRLIGPRIIIEDEFRGRRGLEPWQDPYYRSTADTSFNTPPSSIPLLNGGQSFSWPDNNNQPSTP